MMAAVVAILLLALPALAVTYDDVDITVRSSFGKPIMGHYYEQRLGIANRGKNPHTIRITLAGESPRGGADRSTRTVQIPPRSETLVAIPLLLTGFYTPNEAIVAIDGRTQSERVSLPQTSAWDSATNPNALLTRSVRYNGTPASIDIERFEVAQEWSASWIQYSRFSAIAVTAADWAELPPSVRDAIDRWTFAGGVLVFVDRPDPMPVVSVRSTEGRYGLGRILVFDDGLFDETQILRAMQWRTSDATVFNNAANEVPLLDEEKLPLRAMYGVLILFAIIAGPVNLFLLAKKNRRMWVFGTLPLLALATSVLLVGATFATEGLVRVQRSTAITYLDETLGKAATLGITGFYATLSPRGEIRFAPDTELRVNLERRDAMNVDTVWDDGQRLFGSWVGTRVPTYFAFRKSERRRERLPLQFTANGASAVNGLGAHIEQVWAADIDGNVYEARNVEPGRAFTLVRSSAELDPEATNVVERMVHVDGWLTLIANANDNPSMLLQPGTYVAVLRDSPFIERAMENATEMKPRGIVFGVSRVEGANDAR